mmetsp:Transcript_20781/g.54504  ORF Transcript_20781/g.54504 Transcript_20781/m.54504 type:complete len:285 (+) Transcript_20781:313-1167(+)
MPKPTSSARVDLAFVVVLAFRPALTQGVSGSGATCMKVFWTTNIRGVSPRWGTPSWGEAAAASSACSGGAGAVTRYIGSNCAWASGGSPAHAPDALAASSQPPAACMRVSPPVPVLQLSQQSGPSPWDRSLTLSSLSSAAGFEGIPATLSSSSPSSSDGPGSRASGAGAVFARFGLARSLFAGVHAEGSSSTWTNVLRILISNLLGSEAGGAALCEASGAGPPKVTRRLPSSFGGAALRGAPGAGSPKVTWRLPSSSSTVGAAPPAMLDEREMHRARWCGCATT